jgi:hypothetical protein
MFGWKKICSSVHGTRLSGGVTLTSLIEQGPQLVAF